MKVFRVHYTFEGEGFVDIEADSQEDAEDMFNNEEYEDDGENTILQYDITTITRETGRKC